MADVHSVAFVSAVPCSALRLPKTSLKSEPLKLEARKAISNKVHQLRQVHERAAAAAAATAAADGDEEDSDGGKEGSGDDDDDGDDEAGSPDEASKKKKQKSAAAAAAVETLMPEYVVPYAIHLLAHHPDFPTNKVGTGYNRPRRWCSAVWPTRGRC